MEIQDAYSSKGRYYHTLQHLGTMHDMLQEVPGSIDRMELTLFALFYHDIVYDPLRSDNEERSAEIAVKRLGEGGLDLASVEWVRQAILATKGHKTQENSDVNFLLDADLAVLGFGPSDYEAYTQAIRKEYAIIPDLIYKPGRKKVLRGFLDMDSIFKTVPFQQKFEQQARININEELKKLN